MLTLTGLLLSLLAATAIADEQQLRAHLCSGDVSPLDVLSRPARLRLLESLEFTPFGSISKYPPVTVDLTPEEKTAIIDLLAMEAYRERPRAKLTSSARFNSHAYPALDSAYCTAQEDLAAWTRRARARDEGDLSIALVRFDAHLADIRGQDMPFRDQSAAIAAAAGPILASVREPGWADALDRWVLRDADAQMSFAANLSEAPALVDAAIRVRQLAAQAGGIDSGTDAPLHALKGALDTQVEGQRRIGYLKADGQLVATPVTEPPRFVFVSSLGCGFSRTALSLIAQDEELSEAFSRQVIILAPAQDFDRSAYFRDWNEAYPMLAYRGWYLRGEWPEIALDRFPVFYEITENGGRTVLEGFVESEARQRLGTLRAALGLNER